MKYEIKDGVAYWKDNLLHITNESIRGITNLTESNAKISRLNMEQILNFAKMNTLDMELDSDTTKEDIENLITLGLSLELTYTKGTLFIDKKESVYLLDKESYSLLPLTTMGLVQESYDILTVMLSNKDKYSEV